MIDFDVDDTMMMRMMMIDGWLFLRATSTIPVVFFGSLLLLLKNHMDAEGGCMSRLPRCKIFSARVFARAQDLLHRLRRS
jgi:hypothetical protein